MFHVKRCVALSSVKATRKVKVIYMEQTKYYLITEVSGVYDKKELSKADYIKELKLVELRYKNVPFMEFNYGGREYQTSQDSGLSIYYVHTHKRDKKVVAEYTDGVYFWKLVQEIKKGV